MNIKRLLVAAVFVAAISLSVFAQTRPASPAAQPPATAATQSSGVIPESKIALIYSNAFLDPKTGIARFNTLMSTLNREFQPLQTKVDALEQMKTEYKRKGEDAEASYQKRQGEIFAPLQDDIEKALEVYAKQRGINVIIDASRVPLVYAADNIDITRAFINDFNTKNPATASVTPPE